MIYIDILIYSQLFFISLLLLVFLYKFMLVMLLLMELMVMIISLLMFMILGLMNMEFYLIYYLIFGVCEGVLGLSLLVMIIRFSGGEIYYMFNISKF
uniref:NADH dehydrogenase subunit 4L n=1 Tax=Monomorium pharaonis TaxID=307658 RepID=A0A7L8EYT2_MONPH|nr:NADH dehydrogenase subunit 4L [Monomorium pharaonis]QOE17536.1 NADH dehydrogenase subunit 4L [Monomorium pharaonis]